MLRAVPSVVVQDRTEATILGEQRIAAVIEQLQVERLVSLLLAIALHFYRDGPRRLAGEKGQRTGLGDVILARLGRAVHGTERHRHRLIVGRRERDGEGEQRTLILRNRSAWRRGQGGVGSVGGEPACTSATRRSNSAM